MLKTRIHLCCKRPRTQTDRQFGIWKWNATKQTLVCITRQMEKKGCKALKTTAPDWENGDPETGH